MHSLEKRITELEKASSTGEGPTTVVIRFLSPGNLNKEIQELHDLKNSQQWKRQPGEAGQEFINRASREVKREGPGCALLMAGGLESLAPSNRKPVC